MSARCQSAIRESVNLSMSTQTMARYSAGGVLTDQLHVADGLVGTGERPARTRCDHEIVLMHVITGMPQIVSYMTLKAYSGFGANAAFVGACRCLPCSWARPRTARAAIRRA